MTDLVGEVVAHCDGYVVRLAPSRSWFLATFAPSSFPPPWSWDDERAWLRQHDRVNLDELANSIARDGIRVPVDVYSGGPDGPRVADGHHRIVVASVANVRIPYRDLGPENRAEQSAAVS